MNLPFDEKVAEKFLHGLYYLYTSDMNNSVLAVCCLVILTKLYLFILGPWLARNSRFRSSRGVPKKPRGLRGQHWAN